MSQHAVVFIDREHARIFHLDQSSPDATLEHHVDHANSRRTRNFMDGKAEHVDPHFLDAICKQLAPAQEILIVGPGVAKNELVAHMESKFIEMKNRVVAVEAADHPSDRQLKAMARRRFKVVDLWR